jgi:hypothetical protein
LFGVGIPLVVGGFVGFVGMLRFAPWSRPLSIGTSVVALLGLPFFGPTVEPGLTTALNYFANMSFGAVIAIAYCSPTVCVWFETPPNKPLQPTSGGDSK